MRTARRRHEAAPQFADGGLERLRVGQDVGRLQPFEHDTAGRLSSRLRAQGLHANKRLGQHFLFDPSILRRIVAAAGELGAATVLEIGPGPGGLTRALLAAGVGRLVAVERDPRLRASEPRVSYVACKMPWVPM